MFIEIMKSKFEEKFIPHSTNDAKDPATRKPGRILPFRIERENIMPRMDFPLTTNKSMNLFLGKWPHLHFNHDPNELIHYMQ